jgi:hypothetical protein
LSCADELTGVESTFTNLGSVIGRAHSSPGAAADSQVKNAKSLNRPADP